MVVQRLRDPKFWYFLLDTVRSLTVLCSSSELHSGCMRNMMAAINDSERGVTRQDFGGRISIGVLVLVSFDQRSPNSVLNAIGLHGPSQVGIDRVTKKDRLICKIIFHHTMMREGASCKSGDLSMMCFETISISIVRPQSLVRSPLYYAGEQCSFADDRGTELERARFGADEA